MTKDLGGSTQSRACRADRWMWGSLDSVLLCARLFPHDLVVSSATATTGGRSASMLRGTRPSICSGRVLRRGGWRAGLVLARRRQDRFSSRHPGPSRRRRAGGGRSGAAALDVGMFKQRAQKADMVESIHVLGCGEPATKPRTWHETNSMLIAASQPRAGRRRSRQCPCNRLW